MGFYGSYFMRTASQFAPVVYVPYLPVLTQDSTYDTCSQVKEEAQKAFLGEGLHQQALSPVKDEDILLPESKTADFFEPFTLGKNEKGEDAFFQEETYRCDRLDVENMFRDTSGKTVKSFIRVSFMSEGLYCPVDLPYEAVQLPELHNSASDWMRLLLQNGFGISSDSAVHSTLRHDLREYILKNTPGRFAVITSQPGICDWENRKIFIGQNGKVYGTDGYFCPFMLKKDQNLTDYESKGSFATTQENMKLLAGNPLLIALAGFALNGVSIGLRSEAKSCGVQIVGESHCGKTTSAKVIGSFYGHPENTIVQMMDSTDKGLAIIKPSRRNLMLVIDEIPRDFRRYEHLVYNLMNEGHSTKGNGGHGNVLSNSLQGTVLLTSEFSVEECCTTGKKEPLPRGIFNRLVNIPADCWTYGAFENLHGFADGSEFSMALEKASFENYGHIGWEYIKQFMYDTDKSLNQLEKLRFAFKSNYAPGAISDSIEQSIVRYFADAAASVAYCTQLGILPWHQDDVFEGVADVMRRSLKFHNDAQKPKDQRLLCAVKDYVVAHYRDMRLIRDNSVSGVDCFGFLPRGGAEIYLCEEHLRSALKAGTSGNIRTDVACTVKAMADSRWIQGDRKTHLTIRRTLWKGGKPMPVYCVQVAKVRNFKG